MSKIIAKIFLIIFIFWHHSSFPQKSDKNSFITIFIDLNDKSLENYSISKDTTSASFSIYIKKYESKKERDKATKIYNDKVKNIRTSGENPSDLTLPTFSITFTAFLFKPIVRPERIKTIEGSNI